MTSAVMICLSAAIVVWLSLRAMMYAMRAASTEDGEIRTSALRSFRLASLGAAIWSWVFALYVILLVRDLAGR